MDYRKFLGATKTMVLPYLGGRSVHAPDRRLRVDTPVAVGWWRFEVKGRVATAKDSVEAPELERLPAVRGHLVGDWLFTGADAAVRLHLMPEEEAEPLSAATGRRWPSGDVIFEGLAFDDEPEEAGRAALIDDGTLAEVKGVVPSLRGAFGYARVLREARSRGVQVSVHEVLPKVHGVADGAVTPAALLDEVEARIFQVEPGSTHREAARAERQEAAAAAAFAAGGTEERAIASLEGAGADFLSGRRLDGGNYEVRFRYLGEFFIAVVDAQTLHVYDSGICLEGHDEELGLDSLPSVIAEAIHNGELYITRRA